MSRLSAQQVQKILTDNKAFPSGITQVTHEKRQAFSHHSKLSRYTILLENGETKHIRANVWPASAFRIAKAVMTETTVPAPKPLYYNPKSTTVLYEELSGDILRSLPLRADIWRKYIPKVADLLALFHQTPIPKGLRPESKTFAQRRRTSLVARIVQSDALFGALANAAQKNVHRHLSSSANRLVVLTHGDYQASNILHYQKKLSLLDFTLSRPGHPALDLGLWLIHWQAMTRTHLTNPQRQKLGYLFLETYFQAVPTSWHADLKKFLPIYVAEATLEVAATTVMIYGAKDSNVRALLHELFDSLHYT